MEYIGIQTQKNRNNISSLLLILMFPVLVSILVYMFFFILSWINFKGSEYTVNDLFVKANGNFLETILYVIAAIFVWFVIAYFANTMMIRSATGAKELSRKDNMRVYNLVENLCMSQGMKIPKINIIDDESLNAFASGINERTYTVTLSSGIIEKLDDEELEAVIAHELSHIRNHDVRLLIVSIIFVGIFSMIAQVAFRSVLGASRKSSRNNKENGLAVLLIILFVAAIGYFFSVLMRFAISRKREFLADAGAAEMTKNPLALASALRKISKDPDIEAVEREDVAQLFIQHPGKQASGLLDEIGGIFATHPPIEERIRILEQF